jgi:hypothetical protein
MSTNKTTTPSTLIQPYLFFGGLCEEALDSTDQRWAHR